MAAVASCSRSSSSSLCPLPTPIPAAASHHPPQPPQSMPTLPAPSSAQEKPTFALARLKGDVCLVQVPPTSALAPADVHVFRHEFITLFRYSHRASVHPADLAILERIGDASTLYEEERGTVFLARDVVARMRRLAMPVPVSVSARGPAPPQHAHGRARRATSSSRHPVGMAMAMTMPVSSASRVPS